MGRLLEYSRPEVKVAQTRVETAEVERRDEFQVSLEGPVGRACVGFPARWRRTRTWGTQNPREQSVWRRRK